MLDLPKSILLKIREEREKALTKHRITCSALMNGPPDRNADFYSKRRALLALELPFETDPASIMRARSSAFQQREVERDTFLNIRSEIDISIKKNVNSGEEITCGRAKKLQGKSAYVLLEEWINSPSNEETSKARRTLVNALKPGIQNFYHQHPAYTHLPNFSLASVSASELADVVTWERIEEAINTMKIETTTKDAYRSHGRNLVNFLSKSRSSAPCVLGPDTELSVADAEKIFDYLEVRALKSSTPRAFEDLLLVRALFYIPIESRALFEIGAPDEETRSVLHEGKPYYLPNSFISLRNALFPSNKLLKGKFSEKLLDNQLYKKINRLGRYAGLSTDLTPSKFRQFAKSVLTIAEIDERTVIYLPRR